jgi:hypothetical protein
VSSLANILGNSKLHGTKPDYRFPNQNQLNNCWQTMNEYQVCAEQKGKEDVACLQKARDYHSVCPAKWIEVRGGTGRWGQGRRAHPSPPLPPSTLLFGAAHLTPSPHTHPRPAHAGVEVARRRGPQHHRGQGVLLDCVI